MTESKKTPLRFHSVNSLFLVTMLLFVLVLSMPLAIAGFRLMEKITFQFGVEILTEKLDSQIQFVERRYEKLQQIGLEDSKIHWEEIKSNALTMFAGFGYCKTGKFFVVDRDSKIHLSQEFPSTNSAEFAAFFTGLSKKNSGVLQYRTDKARKLAVYVYYPRWQSYVGISMDHDELFAAQNQFMRLNLIVLGAVIILAILLMFGLRHVIITPLIRLAAFTSQIVQGDYHAGVSGKFIFELSDLKNSINNMVASLVQKMQQTSAQLDLIQKRETELARTLSALKSSEERLQAILENTTSVVYLKDVTGRYITVNRQFEDLFHIFRKSIVGKRDQDIFPPAVAAAFQANDRLVIEENRAVEFEELAPHDDGMHTYISIKFPLHEENGSIYAVAGISTDITGRKRAAERLASEQERLAVTLRSIGDGVITTDTAGRVVMLNKVAEDLTGWSHDEAVGRPVEDIFRIINEKTLERCENPVAKVLSSGQIVDLANHTSLIARDGRERSIADSGAPIRDRESNIIGVVLVFRDVTEKNRMEREMIKIKKLESVGVLAGGIAHDFNNILVGILGNINLALELLDHGNQAQHFLEKAEKASLRAQNLTQQLLTFAKGGEPIKETASIADVIRDSVEFLLHGRKVICTYNIPENLWLVEIDKAQISQVIQNLVMNSCHAMPGGGAIEITCENSAAENNVLSSDKTGRFVKITVRDHGAGIPEKYLDKIFDPFFTTKAGGSGLGLAITHSIITKHGGRIKVESALNSGTTFTIHLPASQQSVPLILPQETHAVQRGKGKILVMDDEDMVREVAGKMLSHLGYKVLLAKEGAEVLDIYRQEAEKGTPVDIVIMDLTIPGGMGGKDAIRKLLDMDPGAKAIVSSGYSNDPVMASHKEHGFKAAMVKPYNMKDLAAIIGKILAEEPSSIEPHNSHHG